jgi:hypothetical protein
LNILDIPAAKSSKSENSSSKRHSRRISLDVPKGRALSPSKIQSPKPMKPYETRQIAQGKFDPQTVEQLTQRFANQQIESSDEESDEEYSDSDASSDVPSLTSRSSNSSSPSSVSSNSSCCTCERYGITRAGDRVKLDCGGARCGYSDGSDCSSDDDEYYAERTTRRQGIVVRS